MKLLIHLLFAIYFFSLSSVFGDSEKLWDPISTAAKVQTKEPSKKIYTTTQKKKIHKANLKATKAATSFSRGP